MPHRQLLTLLRRLADGVAAALLAVIFVAFILQIALRYLFDWPVGWTAELSVIAWLWLVLWGAAFVLRDDEEIRIDLLTQLAGPRGGAVLQALGAIGIVVLFGLALPATYEYVRFMKVEKTSYLHVRFDVLFSIYILFSVAVIGRHLWNLVLLLRGKKTVASSGTAL
jgi:TRAP-type C4-dicarboxylate transport system permease small subunit